MFSKWSYAKYSAIFSIIGFLVGIQNLFLARFDFSIIRTASFWSDSLNTTATYFLTILLVVLMKAEKFEATDENIQGDKSFIRKFALTDLKPSFKVFNDKTTLENKANAWKEKINKKLMKVENKATILDRAAWVENDETNKYVQKKKHLLTLIDEEYIKENIHYLKVKKSKYEVIQDSTIINDYTPKNNFKFKRENSIWMIVKDTAPKFILGTVYTIVLSSFALEFKSFDMETAYKMAVKVGSLLLHAVWGVSYAPKFINKQIIVPLTNAVQHIKNYLIWEKNRKDVITSETTKLHD